MHMKTFITKCIISQTNSCKSVFQITQISQKIWPVRRFDFHHIHQMTAN